MLIIRNIIILNSFLKSTSLSKQSVAFPNYFSMAPNGLTGAHLSILYPLALTTIQKAMRESWRWEGTFGDALTQPPFHFTFNKVKALHDLSMFKFIQ